MGRLWEADPQPCPFCPMPGPRTVLTQSQQPARNFFIAPQIPAGNCLRLHLHYSRDRCSEINPPVVDLASLVKTHQSTADSSPVNSCTLPQMRRVRRRKFHTSFLVNLPKSCQLNWAMTIHPEETKPRKEHLGLPVAEYPEEMEDPWMMETLPGL
ncbi:hypothetical protein UY3_07990 [Chelonia mydas]|uniref:Uncharacterized protein n=1 Tax=Chelonia mydas TaxID=8469 RepID=M7BRZ4_CHEMY|nr:hypothetical protein UY3_07990 [Chelonia mydas]